MKVHAFHITAIEKTKEINSKNKHYEKTFIISNAFKHFNDER